ncbi:Hsp70 family protein [Actinomycetospora sp. CA-101289]|uniref:Hsp70 family protein n=1 Tax=Actinomycetospora sp. CA-101289 TaxID=3239893 RepID=UPI003D98F42A
MTEWSLAVDFGTTFTTAAMVSGETVNILELDGSVKIPSAVALDDEGELVVGLASGDEAGWPPERVERNPKRSLGRTRHLVLDGTPIPVADAVAALLRAIADEGTRRRNGVPPTKLVLTHPVRWSASRRAELAAAAIAAGLPEPIMVAEPVAAAMHYLDESIAPGDLVAVYDLGGGTFDAAVLRRTSDGLELAGEPGGNADLGGERLDDLLYGMVGARLSAEHSELWEQMAAGSTPTARRQAAELRRDVRRAKEALSRQQAYTVHIAAVGADLRITRPEFEALVTAPLRDTVDELAATIERCDVAAGDVAAIYLVGGASRIPLVTRLVSERFGELPATFDDPKSVVVLGAAGLVRDRPAAVPETAPAAPAPVYAEPVAPTVTPPLGTPVAAGPAGAGASTGTRRPRTALLVSVAAAALVAALVGGGVAFLGPRLASSSTPVPAANVVPAAQPVAPAVAPPPTTTTADAPATTTRPRATTTTTTSRPPRSSSSTAPTTESCSSDCMTEDPMTGDTYGSDTGGTLYEDPNTGSYSTGY